MWRCSYRRRHMDSSRGVEHRYCTQIERRRGCCRFLLRRQSSSHKAAAPRIVVCAAAWLLLCSNQQFTAPTASPWFGSLLPRGQISCNSSACICMAIPRNQDLRDMLPRLSAGHRGHVCAWNRDLHQIITARGRAVFKGGRRCHGQELLFTP